jgi:hypothetical protein
MLNRNPTIGIGYERRLSKWFSIASHLSSFYQNYSDSYFLSNFPDRPIIDIYRGSLSPFMNEQQQKALERKGISSLPNQYFIKTWAVPIDIGVTIYPLHHTHHQLGVNLGFSMTYENRNYWKDYITGVLILKDGKEQPILLSIPTEFRNFSPGFTTKIKYQYQFNQTSFGLRIANYNLFFISLFGALNDVYWDSSIFFTYKF